VAGHADLAAAGFKQGALIELGPLLDRGFEPGIQCCGPGERGSHKPWLMRTHVLARLPPFALCLFGSAVLESGYLWLRLVLPC
jgi:hypothetical protein